MSIVALPAATDPPGGAIGRSRLFWKLFLGFWLTLLAAGLAVGFAVWLHQQQHRPTHDRVLAAGPRAELLLDAAAATLRHGGEPALRALLLDDETRPAAPRSRLFAVDEGGRDVLDRPVPATALARARRGSGDAVPAHAAARGAARRVVSADGRDFLLFVAASDATGGAGAASPRDGGARPAARPFAGRWRMRLSPLAAIAVGLLASLVFSGALAWYLTRPIRHLRSAFAAVASGRLDARVAPALGRRADELAQLGHDFDRMAERLQRLIAAQQRLLHDVSHELRSPLARLHAAVGLARQDPERGAAMLGRIEREAQRLDALVGEVLALARLDAGTQDADVHAADLVELIGAVVDDARFEAQAQGRDLRFVWRGHGDGAAAPHEPDARRRGAPALPVQARGDWLQRAFENVVRNALRHAPESGVVEVALAVDAAQRATVTVADRGPGVPVDELETIFEPFERGRRATGHEGYGLGLAIARRALAAHGGTIAAANREGGGLVVTIELPLAPLSRTPDAARAGPGHARAATTRSRR